MASQLKLNRWHKSIVRNQSSHPDFACDQCALFLKELPENQEVLLIAARLSLQLKRYVELEGYAEQLIALGDNSEQIWLWSIQGKLQVKNIQGGKKSLLQAKQHISSRAGLHEFAVFCSALGNHQLAKACFSELLEMEPNFPEAVTGLALTEQFLGNIEEAENLLRQALLFDEGKGIAHYHLSRTKTFTKENNNIKELNREIKFTTTNTDAYSCLAFSLAKEYEDIGNNTEAFQWLKKANQSSNSQINYTPDIDRHVLDVTTRLYPVLPTGKPLTKAPIFILGMPRTGSTLTERIISAHSRVDTVGESSAMIASFRRTLGDRRVDPNTIEKIITGEKSFDQDAFSSLYTAYGIDTDSHSEYQIEKLPQNIFYTGLILKCFPNAKIIYTRRNPMDSCLSNYKMIFNTGIHAYSYDLNNLADNYIMLEQTTQYWQEKAPNQFYISNYEDLVNQPEESIRKLLSFIGLGEEEACFSPEKNKLSVSTASSAQVREGINTKRLNAWKKFEKELQPLKKYFISQWVEID